MKQQYSMDFDIVLGADTNVTFPADCDDISGGNILSAAKTHTPSMMRPLRAWFSALGLQALNTYPTAECQTDGCLDAAKTRTCGRKRRLQKRAQIDFIGVTPGFEVRHTQSTSPGYYSIDQIIGQWRVSCRRNRN